MEDSERSAPTDEALVRDAQNGVVRAFEALLDRHQARVLRVLRLMGVPAQDREDVAQEVFIRVFRHIGGFRPERPFGAWLYQISVNASHDYRTGRQRRERAEAPLDEAYGERATGPEEDPAVAAERGELRRALEAALPSLTERERAVFVLRELEGLETPEVARALGVTSITVRRHLSLARRRLRRALSGLESRSGERIERPVRQGGSYP